MAFAARAACERVEMSERETTRHEKRKPEK